MAKSKSRRPARASRRPARASGRSVKKAARSSAARPARKRSASAKKGRKKPVPRNTTARKTARRPTAKRSKPSASAGLRTKPARLDRERRHLEEEVVPTPPSSLNMNRHGSAARTGRAELAESRQEHRGMTPAITGGDVDVDVENAYFSGDEAPGGDNPTPDQEVVDDIGRALGVEYEDNEELKASDKVTERDRHRWELDPASSEDYKERK